MITLGLSVIGSLPDLLYYNGYYTLWKYYEGSRFKIQDFISPHYKKYNTAK